MANVNRFLMVCVGLALPASLLLFRPASQAGRAARAKSAKAVPASPNAAKPMPATRGASQAVNPKTVPPVPVPVTIDTPASASSSVTATKTEKAVLRPMTEADIKKIEAITRRHCQQDGCESCASSLRAMVMLQRDPKDIGKEACRKGCEAACAPKPYSVEELAVKSPGKIPREYQPPEGPDQVAPRGSDPK